MSTDGMDGLIQAMSDKDLSELKTKFSDNPSVVTLIEGILESRVAEAEKAKVLDQFTSGIAKTFDKLPHPDTVHNVYARWSEVEVEDESVEAEEVNVPATDEVEAHMELRRPKTKVWQWVVSVNHAVQVKSGTKAPTGNDTSKRAITVRKHNPDGADTVAGNYPSASKACEGLGLTIGGDSAVRVLTREGYYTEPYTGTDITS